MKDEEYIKMLCNNYMSGKNTLISKKTLVILAVLVVIASCVAIGVTIQSYGANIVSQGIIYANENNDVKIYNPNEYREDIIKVEEPIVEIKPQRIRIPVEGHNGIVIGKQDTETTININGVEYKKARPYNPKTDGVPEFLKDRIKK